MPRKTDTMPLGSEFLSRRVKLLPCQKERIVAMRETGISIRKLATIFGVDKRLIQFIVNPDALEACKLARKLRGGSGIYYNREQNTSSMKEHRDYKKQVFSL